MLLCGGLQAATLERLSMDDLIQKSTEIVRGRVVACQFTQRGPVIYSVSRIQVLERWKGASAAVVEVQVPGGRLGGIRQTFSGAPQLTEGQEYVLFLWTGRSGVTQVIGFSQGLLDVKKTSSGEPLAVRTAITETILEPSTGRRVSDDGVEMPLRELSERIRKTLGAVKE